MHVISIILTVFTQTCQDIGKEGQTWGGICRGMQRVWDWATIDVGKSSMGQSLPLKECVGVQEGTEQRQLWNQLMLLIKQYTARFYIKKYCLWYWLTLQPLMNHRLGVSTLPYKHRHWDLPVTLNVCSVSVSTSLLCNSHCLTHSP